MVKKVSTTLLVLIVIGLALNFTFNNAGSDRRTVVAPNIEITGFEAPVFQGKPVVQFDNNIQPIVYSDSIVETYSVRTGPQSIYDLQSNGVPQQIWQNPANPLHIHATMMVNLTTGVPAGDRRCYYMFSDDGGTTWTDFGPVAVAGSGFCVCSGLSDGAAILGSHTEAGSAPVRWQLFADVAPGAGTFTRLDPGQNPFNSLQNIWGRLMPTSNLSNPRKVVTLSSINSTSADTVASFNTALSVTSSSFSGYVRNMDIGNAEVYSFARASDGRIGCAYVANSNVVTANNGLVKYIYTTDNGLTWTAPLTIWNPPPYLDGVFGGLRGVTLTFVGTTPKVAFELMGVTDAGYYPSGRAAIGFWSPNVNSGNAYVTPFDSTWMQNGNGGITDVYTSICRPSIAKSQDESTLLMAFPVSRADTDAVGSHFYDVYFTWSTNGGTSWKFPPVRVTNNSGPLRDNRFPSLSPTNHVAGGFVYAHLLYQVDSIPGAAVPPSPAAESLAKQWYTRMKIADVIGIQTIGSEIPKSFALHQNFPNPFNPETKIRFEMPKSENVTLKVYNATGQLVAILANNEPQSAGLKEVTFNANGLASGIYFYSIQAGSFNMTKKMILVK